MKFKILAIAMAVLITISQGCAPFSPRQKQNIDNQNGKIGEIENLANSVKAELGSMKAQNDIQNSKLEKIQQGLANWQSNYENSGVQILSGPGGLLFALIALILGVAASLHYRNAAKIQAKTADIMAKRITERRDPALEDAVFQAAMYTEVEENVLNLIKKHKGQL